MTSAEYNSQAGAGPVSTDRQEKLCPILSMGLTSGVGKSRTLSCLGENCAWWNAKLNQCGVLPGAGE